MSDSKLRKAERQRDAALRQLEKLVINAGSSLSKGVYYAEIARAHIVNAERFLKRTRAAIEAGQGKEASK